APVGTVVLSVTGQRNRYRKKAVKMLLLVVLLFIICWTPIEVLEVVYILHRQVAQPQKAYLKFYLQCLAFSSTALNPFVYAFLNNKFRKSFINFMPRRSRRVEPMNVPDPPQLPSDAACNKTGTSSESYNSKSRMCSLRSTKSTEL
ncbi:kiSS-1 receptor, partial [Biomphalaria glabrata]